MRISVPEFLRRETARLSAQPTMREWLERTGRHSSEISRQNVQDTLDEMRGPWPGNMPSAGRQQSANTP